jgi:hypothetical protein
VEYLRIECVEEAGQLNPHLCSSEVVLSYSNRAGEVQVELKSQSQAWEEKNRRAVVKFHGLVYFLCVVGIMPLHICFLLRTSFICCVCDLMEELNPE